MQIDNTEKLQADILAELKLINVQSFKALNAVKTNNLNSIDKIIELVNYAQTMEKEAIRIRLLVNQFCGSVNYYDLNNANTITVSSVIDWTKKEN